VADSLNHMRTLDPGFMPQAGFFQGEPGKGVYPKEMVPEELLTQFQEVVHNGGDKITSARSNTKLR
jgi:hypothetical protein